MNKDAKQLIKVYRAKEFEVIARVIKRVENKPRYTTSSGRFSLIKAIT